MEYRKIDLKVYLDEKMLEWYNNELNIFFTILLEEKIVSYSDNIENLFRDTPLDKLFDNDIKSLLGEINYNFFKKELDITKEQNYFIKLPEPVSDKYISIKWKTEKRDGENLLLLLFKTENSEEIEELKVEVKKGDFIDKTVPIPYIITDSQTILYISEEFNQLNLDIKTDDINSLYNSFKELFNIEIETNFSLINKIANIKDKEYFIYVKSFTNKKVLVILETTNTLTKIQSEKTSENIEKLIKENSELEQENIYYKEQLNNLNLKLEELKKIEDEKNLNNETEQKKVLFFIKETTDNMSKLKELIALIEDISIKVHLISINAAIESARVGEVGKGFAVIAKELEKLASSTKNYTKTLTKEIALMITRMNENIKNIE